MPKVTCISASNPEVLKASAAEFIRILDRTSIDYGQCFGVAEMMKCIYDGDAQNNAETVTDLINLEGEQLGEGPERDVYDGDARAYMLWSAWFENSAFRAEVVAQVIAINAATLDRIAEANKD